MAFLLVGAIGAVGSVGAILLSAGEEPVRRGGAAAAAAHRDSQRHGGAPPRREEGTAGGLWPRGEVYYTIDSGVEHGLKMLIYAAIADFHKKTPVRWIDKDRVNADYYVTFVQDNRECPRATVGCCFTKSSSRQKISLPYPNYPSSSSKLKHICVLHEMGHCIGLAHEHSRPDRDSHVQCGVLDNNTDTAGVVQYGNYDYYSIMHYGHGAGSVQCKTAELRERADKGLTFSAGDIAIIRKLYLGRTAHHGEWHRPCSRRCTPTMCCCGACGRLHDGANCGYTGMKGHWSCCMCEDETSSVCRANGHTGFWHAECDWSKGCTDTICRCGNCVGGCRYTGRRAHWSCCGSETLRGRCLKTPYLSEA